MGTLNFQSAVIACEADWFIRPIAWGGTGRAVDVAHNVAARAIFSVRAMNGTALVLEPWKPTREELLERWELVQHKTLEEERVLVEKAREERIERLNRAAQSQVGDWE